jgi:undecaprenyl diphosphate synthase
MHVAIIMDGNGRWAERRGLPRVAGHRAGARAVRRIVEAAVRSGIDVLTLYAFSSDNWSRPAEEVDGLMRLLKRHLQSEAARCVENGVRVSVIGRRDRLSRELVRIIEQTEQVTAACDRMILQLAIDYSAREAIVRAATQRDEPCEIDKTIDVSALESSACSRAEPDRAVQSFARRIARAAGSPLCHPNVDLLIRTGGERRLSDFLLWEIAYAELVFVDDCWPDFDERRFDNALMEFHSRERRYGGLPSTPSGLLAGEGH